MLYYSTVCMESRTYACVSWNIHVNAYEMKNVVLCFYVQVQITVTWYLYSFFKVTEVTLISNEWITRKKGQMKYGMYLHVYIPRRIGHDHREFAQHRHIKIPHVTLNPLKWRQHTTSLGKLVQGICNYVNILVFQRMIQPIWFIYHKTKLRLDKTQA